VGQKQDKLDVTALNALLYCFTQVIINGTAGHTLSFVFCGNVQSNIFCRRWWQSTMKPSLVGWKVPK
jgi:hypothetical protein